VQLEQRTKVSGEWDGPATLDASLVLAFGSPSVLESPETWADLARRYPNARRVGCSTAGEIVGARVFDEALACTAIARDHGRTEVASVAVSEHADGAAIGAALAALLSHEGLVHVLVLSEGLSVNGSALAKGLAAGLPARVAVSGGLSADGERFKHTRVCVDAAAPSDLVVAIGFYGERLRVGYGSAGGWSPFGAQRRISKSAGNVLHELDGEPALDLYKRYLGDHAAALPASALLFPLALSTEEGDVVRTVGGIDEAARTMTFVGEVPLGRNVRLMRASLERIVDGASTAARATHPRVPAGASQLAVLVSCVGRRLLLKQRVEEELDAVVDALGGTPVVTGFYSYGELSPHRDGSTCELHNQTMTITVFSEE
jgi:hypothetical protein